MGVTREKFAEYVSIRNSGVTNMFDIRYIVEHSGTGLTRDDCLYIMQNFMDLAEEFKIEV